MRAYPNHRAGTRGSALITLMLIMLVVAVAGAAMVGFAKQQTYASQRVRDYLKAQAYAEAGANAAYNLMKTNFAACAVAANFPRTDFGEGYYDATVTQVDSNTASILCVGGKGTATATVKVDVKNFPQGTGSGGGPPPLTSPWAYGMFINGTVTFNGASTFGGYLFSNNQITQNGSSTYGEATNPVHIVSAVGITMHGNQTLYGDLTAPTISATVSPGTKIEKPVAKIAMPTLDYAGLLQQAQLNHQVATNVTISGNTTWDIGGGVKWIEGTLTVNKKTTLSFNGTIVATGNITFNGGFDNSAATSEFLIVSRDGTITMNGASNFRGFAVSKGDMTFNGSGTFIGGLILGGNLTFNGSGCRLTYGYFPTTWDTSGGGGTTVDKVVVTAWQK